MPDNMREKLIELIMQKGFGAEGAAIAADHLIANGVTVQKWIPVTERLPEDARKVLALTKAKFLNVGGGSELYVTWLVRYNRKKGAFYDYDSEWGEVKVHDVTHWMPLPQPPKGE